MSRASSVKKFWHSDSTAPFFSGALARHSSHSSLELCSSSVRCSSALKKNETIWSVCALFGVEWTCGTRKFCQSSFGRTVSDASEVKKRAPQALSEAQCREPIDVTTEIDDTFREEEASEPREERDLDIGELEAELSKEDGDDGCGQAEGAEAEAELERAENVPE